MLFLLLPIGEPQLPIWANERCIQQIENIVQHEVGATYSMFIYEFVAQQVVYDVPIYGCKNLTVSRWKIGVFNNQNVNADVRYAVFKSLLGLYNHRYPPCKFIGNLGDIEIWRSFGYFIRVDYKFQVKPYTVIGTNCK